MISSSQATRGAISNPNPLYNHTKMCKQLCTSPPIVTRKQNQTMAPDTGLQPFVNVPASMALPTIPTSPRAVRDPTVDEEQIDPDAKLILSDFTQSILG